MTVSVPNSFRLGPDERGRFGLFGGRFVAETLMPLILDLERQYEATKTDPTFQAEFNNLLTHYVGRPSPLYFAERLTAHLRAKAAAAGKSGGAKVYFKREELNHTGAHKINNVLGQILLARRMGKTRIIAETGAGQHGVATATACARFGLDCVVYMGAVDVERQKPNVFRMNMLGATVVPVQAGARTLKDAMNEALRDWVANVHDTFYCIGTAAGPHPYPAMVRDFQCIIGTETKRQMHEAEGRLPDSLFACIGGGSNAIGLFHPFLDDPSVEIFGVEAAGFGLDKKHAASLAGGKPGVLHGNRTYLLMDEHGRSRRAIPFRRGSTIPGSGRSTLGSATAGASPISPRPTRKRSTPSISVPSSRASSRRWSRRTRLPASSTSPRSGRRTISWCSTCRAAATRTSPRSPRIARSGRTAECDRSFRAAKPQPVRASLRPKARLNRPRLVAARLR